MIQLPSFTLDTNCLIDIEDQRPAAPAVRTLLEAADRGNADVAMVASSASERQPGGGLLTTIEAFRQRMTDLGFGGLSLLRPIGTYNFSFYDWAVYPTPAQSARQNEIFQCLFPGIENNWLAYAAARNLDSRVLDSHEAFAWRNRFCDVQALWAHDDSNRDIFVTSDDNFGRRLAPDPRFTGVVVVTPQDATLVL